MWWWKDSFFRELWVPWEVPDQNRMMKVQSLSMDLDFLNSLSLQF